MKFTGPAASLPPHPDLDQAGQEATILAVAAQIGVPACFLAAVRIAEAGAKGREFGVLSEPADTYREQATISAVSIRNAQYRFVQATGDWPIDTDGLLSDAFIRAMAARWAPPGADNDPNNLNAHWVENVTQAYRQSGLI